MSYRKALFFLILICDTYQMQQTSALHAGYAKSVATRTCNFRTCYGKYKVVCVVNFSLFSD